MWTIDNERYGNDCIIKDHYVYSGGVLYHTKSYRGSWTPDEPDHHAENMTPEEVVEYLEYNSDTDTVDSFLREYPEAKVFEEISIGDYIEEYFDEIGEHITSGMIDGMISYLEERGIYITIK